MDNYQKAIQSARNIGGNYIQWMYTMSCIIKINIDTINIDNVSDMINIHRWKSTNLTAVFVDTTYLSTYAIEILKLDNAGHMPEKFREGSIRWIKELAIYGSVFTGICQKECTTLIKHTIWKYSSQV